MASDDMMIRVWNFYDAPEEFRSLSTNGGDEDWIAVLPPGYMEKHTLYAGMGREPGLRVLRCGSP